MMRPQSHLDLQFALALVLVCWAKRVNNLDWLLPYFIGFDWHFVGFFFLVFFVFVFFFFISFLGIAIFSRIWFEGIIYYFLLTASV